METGVLLSQRGAPQELNLYLMNNQSEGAGRRSREISADQDLNIDSTSGRGNGQDIRLCL